MNDRERSADHSEDSLAQPRLSARVRYGYACGNFGKGLQNSTVDLLFLFFLTDYLGASPAMAGAGLFAIACVNCVADLIFGHVVDRRGAAGPSYRRLIIIGVAASAAAFIAMFLWPLLAPDLAISLALGWHLVFRLSYTAVDVPYNALLAALTRNSHERGRLSSLRFLFSSGGNLTVSALIALCLSQRDHDFGGLASYVGVVTLLYLVAMFACIRSIGSVRSSAMPGAASPGSLAKALVELGRNTVLVRVLLLCMLAAALITIFSRMALFYAQSFLGDASAAAALIFAQITGQIVSLPLWSRLQARFEKRTVALLAYSSFAIAMAAFLSIVSSNSVTAMAIFCFAGMGLSGLTVMNWAMVPDTIEFTERSAGVRHEALTFGLLVMLTKIASGAGTGLVGLCLEVSGYRPSGAGNELDSNALLLAMTALPAIGAVACILILTRLRLSFHSHAVLAGR